MMWETYMDEVLCEQSWFYKIVIYTVKSTIKGTYFFKEVVELGWNIFSNFG